MLIHVGVPTKGDSLEIPKEDCDYVNDMDIKPAIRVSKLVTSVIVENQAAPEFGEPILLDLQGGGIRALSYDPVMQAFLIVNETEGYDNNRYSQLWSWGGDPDMPPEPVALPDIINLNNVESIDSITIDGEARLLLMSDEGSKKKNRPAQYMMLEYGQLAR